MVIKKWQKEKAVKLRMEGYTYSEILEKVPVARSTLSLWLRDVGLSKSQIQRITKKKKDSSKKGADKLRKRRLEKTKAIKTLAKKEIGDLGKRDLWIAGTMLYWAEGAKQKEHNTSQGVDFGNSDPRMINIFLIWMETFFGIRNEQLRICLYIHENSKDRMEEVYRYWSLNSGIKKEDIVYTYFKKHNFKTKRKKIGDDYFGLIRIVVKSSTDLNRQIEGWFEGLSENCRIV